MKCSGTRLALEDLKSAGDSTGASAGGSTVSTGSTVSGVLMKGVDCSSSSLETGCTGKLEGSFLKNGKFLVTVRSPFCAEGSFLHTCSTS